MWQKEENQLGGLLLKSITLEANVLHFYTTCLTKAFKAMPLHTHLQVINNIQRQISEKISCHYHARLLAVPHRKHNDTSFTASREFVIVWGLPHGQINEVIYLAPDHLWIRRYSHATSHRSTLDLVSVQWREDWRKAFLTTAKTR